MNTGTCLDWKCPKEGIDKEKLGSFCHFNEYTFFFSLHSISSHLLLFAFLSA